MQKRYRVFISSTTDLHDARDVVVRAVQACDCIPCFMEVWPARAEKLTEHLKREIDLCDFFILLAGNRYGSRESDKDGAGSFVELEYEHALNSSPRIGIIVLMTGEISIAKSEDADSKAQREFRKRVRETHTARSWRDSTDLTRAVMASLMNEIIDRESAQVVESNAELVACLTAYVDEQKNRRRKIIRAVLVQYSAANAKDILKKLIWSGVNTELYVASSATAAGVSDWQKNRVEEVNPSNLRNFLEPLDENAKLGELDLCSYKVKGSIRALMLDVEETREVEVEDDAFSPGTKKTVERAEPGFVAIGAYSYMIRWPQDIQQEDIRGGEMPMTVFRKEHSGCKVIASMIQSVVDNWRKFDQVNIERVPLGKQRELTGGRST